MAEKHLFIAFQNAVEGREEESEAWYRDYHMPEVVEHIQGFVAGQRYRLSSFQRPGTPPSKFGYITIYELEGSLEEIGASNRRASEAGVFTPHGGAVADDRVGYFFTPLGDRVERPGNNGEAP